MSILYVDHEVNNLNAFKASFRRDAEIFLAHSTDEGIRILNERKIDIIFADHQMPDMTGIEFLRFASSHFPNARRVILTGNAYTDEFRAAADKGYFHKYINKPWDEHLLRALMLEEN